MYRVLKEFHFHHVTFEQKLRKMGEQRCEYFFGRVFQTEVSARSKALEFGVSMLCFEVSKEPMCLERREG